MEDQEPSADFDVVVIGGGINGAGVARDAAGRGLRVLLAEKDDLAEHTSSASSKMIHGGLRYLEHYDFPLVRHALMEREVMLAIAPHIVWPLRIVLPHHRELRPAWLIRIGLFLYDHLGGRKRLPASRGFRLRNHEAGSPVKAEFIKGFEYSDCWVQDARLVVLNARSAAEKGAKILTRTEVTRFENRKGTWHIEIQDKRNGQHSTVRSRVIVNASGPWVEKTLQLDPDTGSSYNVRLVKGSHIVVPRIVEHEYGYIFQHSDGRVVFVLPFENDFTLIGTTDIEIDAEPGPQQIDQQEVDYLCQVVSHYFETPVVPSQVVWSYSGVRPLYDDASSNASKVTRDYKLEMTSAEGATMLSVFGGKITTYRKLSEQVVDMLELGDPARSGWTAEEPLPGGDIPAGDFDRYVADCRARWPWLPEHILVDWIRNYGTEVQKIVGTASSLDGLGPSFGAYLLQAEVDYLIGHEWAKSATDILWRRTKKGLRLSESDVSDLQHYIGQRQ